MFADSPIINEYTIQEKLTRQQMDAVWANGWRHFGSYFFRYSQSGWQDMKHIIPLRIQLADFFLSKSQKRVLSKNRDLRVIVRDAFIDAKKVELFDRHKTRFTENVPQSLSDFIGENPATVPCETKEICLFKNNRLVGVSFWDIGEIATSSIYAMFEPEEAQRSLGIYLILLSIVFSIRNGKTFYYHGYAHAEPSFYDYKKKFHALYFFDWKSKWLPLQRSE